MYKRFLITLCLVVVLVSTVPSVTQAAFSETQLRAVVELLKSFGVSAEVISKVETSLRTTIEGGPVVKVERPISVEPGVYKPPTAWRHAICNRIFNKPIGVGERGEPVRDVQGFLREEGFFSGEATGYFGRITQESLGNWQTEQGLVAPADIETAINAGWGTFGPRTREHVRMWCDKGYDQFKAEPQFGTAPLTVTFSAWVGGLTPFQFWLDFGDGSARAPISCSAPADACTAPGTVTHTYAANGTYTAVLYRSSATSTLVGVDGIGKKLIHVGPKKEEGCTKEYKPVCGQPKGCKVNASGTEMCSKPEPQTYSNHCMREHAGASFISEGQCGKKSFEPGPRCKGWYDGCNDCTRETPGGPARCTERMCIWQAPGYCTAEFPKTGTEGGGVEGTGNRPPVISSVSGPATLAVNASGTWTIQASDPENSVLTYRIRWGEETAGDILSSIAGLTDTAFSQTNTFTHTYSKAGNYRIVVWAKDSAGKVAEADKYVKVGSGSSENPVACTLQYNPICGQPPEPACRSSLPACMVPTPGPTTYSNECFMHAAKATFLYMGQCKTEGGGIVACPADAKRCEDGTWVGRTGTGCEFKCPVPTTNTTTGCRFGLKTYAGGTDLGRFTAPSNSSETTSYPRFVCDGTKWYSIPQVGDATVVNLDELKLNLCTTMTASGIQIPLCSST